MFVLLNFFRLQVNDTKQTLSALVENLKPLMFVKFSKKKMSHVRQSAFHLLPSTLL